MLMNGKYYLTRIRYRRKGKIIEYYRIDVNNKRVYYSKYEELDDGYAKVMKNGKWGILTPNGNVWGQMEYTSIASSFSEDMIRVSMGGKIGYADKSTGRFIPCIFEAAEDFHEGVARVKCKNGKWRTINTVGKFID